MPRIRHSLASRTGNCILLISAMLLINAPIAYADYANPAFDKGVECMNHGDYDEAINAFDEAIGFNNTNAKAYLLRGKCFYQANNLQMAVADFDHCLKIAPDTSDAFLWRGTSHARLGKDDLATNDYEQAIKLDPKLAEQFFHAPKAKEEAQPIRAQVISHGNSSEIIMSETSHEKKSSSIKSVDDYKEAMKRLYPDGLDKVSGK